MLYHIEDEDFIVIGERYGTCKRSSGVDANESLRQVGQLPTPAKTSAMSNVTCSQRGDQISSETDTNQSGLRVESSCSAPNKTYTDQIQDDKPSTRNAAKLKSVLFHNLRLEKVIATHRKEVVQHGNIFELSSHLIQEGCWTMTKVRA